MTFSDSPGRKKLKIDDTFDSFARIETPPLREIAAREVNFKCNLRKNFRYLDYSVVYEINYAKHGKRLFRYLNYID